MCISVEEYYKTYGPMVLRRCRYYLRNEAEAYDVMQDVFVKVIKNADKIVEKNPAALLLRIATNESLNRIRSMKRRPTSTYDDEVAGIAFIEDAAGSSIARLTLDSIFSTERESTKQMVDLHLVEGRTLEETAHEVGYSVSGVRRRLEAFKSRIKEFQYA